jgi:hypothetical protein
MRRLFWMGVGAAATVVLVRRARRALGPYAEVAAPVTAWLGSVRDSFTEFTTTMAAHEDELRRAFVEDAGNPDRERPDPRRPAPPSWASPRVVDDDDELYSF